MIAVVIQIVTGPTGRWQSIDCSRRLKRPFSTGRSLVHPIDTCAGDSVVGGFSRIKILLGRSETRTRERKDIQSIRTV